MKITIKTKNIKVTKKIEEHIKEKANALEKIIDIKDSDKKRKTLKEIVVEVGKETMHHQKGFIFRAEMQMHLPGKTLYAEATREKLEFSINDAKEELEREIKKYKGRKASIRRRKEMKIKKDIKLSPQARMYRKGRIREEGL